jgi:ParB-like chromosome segregation protein Spo0J
MKLRDKITRVSTQKLQTYKKNNKTHPEEQITLLVENIDRFGFTVPILIDKDNVIIAGHARFEAAKRLNLEEVSCIMIDDLTEEEVKALRIADNRISELAETNWDFLKEEYLDLKDLDEGLEFITGYSDSDFKLDKEEISLTPSNDSSGEGMKLSATCPKCGHHFNPAKN